MGRHPPVSKPVFGCLRPKEIAALSGLEFFQQLLDGKVPLPPITEDVPMRLKDVREGYVLWETWPTDRLLNTMGGVHGGYYMAVLDSCLGCAVHSALPAGRAYTTLEAKTNLIKPVKADGTIYLAEGEVLKVGGRVGTAVARIIDESGTLYAHGTTTCLIFDAPTG